MSRRYPPPPPPVPIPGGGSSQQAGRPAWVVVAACLGVALLLCGVAYALAWAVRASRTPAAPPAGAQEEEPGASCVVGDAEVRVAGVADFGEGRCAVTLAVANRGAKTLRWVPVSLRDPEIADDRGRACPPDRGPDLALALAAAELKLMGGIRPGESGIDVLFIRHPGRGRTVTVRAGKLALRFSTDGSGPGRVGD
jgi:hypothetical protein